MNPVIINFVYLFCALCFIFGIKLLSSPATARRGNLISAIGMLTAVVVTLWDQDVISLEWILIGLAIGTIIGIPIALRVKMTAMPEMVALLNGSGGLASLLLGWSSYHADVNVSTLDAATVFLAVLIGGLTFTGSIIAWAKLKGVKWIKDRPVLFPGQKIFNAVLLLAAIALGWYFSAYPAAPISYTFFIVIVSIALVLGVLAVIPIGGADMPVVIALLNSYSGLAACAAGFVINNMLLIVAGSLVGASGIILSMIMCKAMNRSLANVLFGGFGAITTGGKEFEGEMKATSPQDAYYVLEAAESVVITPGYGLAVAQAQHAVKELGDVLEKNGADVKYAIHPVAGRMPGHMNVLLAEANVPYDQLVEMEDINPIMNTVDVCIVVGANDTVNPAARTDETSPIYGMPIVNADYAKTVFALKRGRGKGFAGIENPLFLAENTRMLFGDAKDTLTALIAEFKS
ncbi:MAG: NAD(P)(+) transhydrogenase (Re/Si-specific) subunit beta [Waddliaceae bacterium]|jgi:H+-translocating NAD(P) transhydrogenase subunit beta|nr:NAD(P)(+) transhydrogenase (Re/Si-specific) subunit beta [Waddliaceae bacterium]MBT3579037.1 NAD(P)(+) transhydrogenase (Re/Si-specific) subunit beta [Waddliaceae bacterium]MBT4445423.1 NAD(P)(+) transhydrogenase (Re/Si-specific) subunit beta [Waddliaceae bacterium]MBT6928822.1 NAD(P)(+) transhydrogenase (Re/Si-specific) subunit beta [Waddliaceae bacterium]MBT7263960.1 NAD(P)(+) transhydrogenase (Re/Si-specific) subunit beta [Waddliaceae bacterium]